MPAARFFIDSELREGDLVTLSDDEAFHLTKVMRKASGATIELINGKNQLAIATVEKGSHCRILSVENASPPHLPIILLQALPRLNKLDWIVEKGTELGMTELWLFPGERSEKGDLTPTQQQRLHHLAVAAMKQCGRLDLPTILLKPPLLSWTALPCRGYFGDVDPKAPFFLSCLDKSEGICFCVGPESGLTELEEAHLRQLDARGVRLHPNILRTETAPLVALSLINS